MEHESNRAELVGTIGEDVRWSHRSGNTFLYKTVLHVQRTSGTIDKVPLIVRSSILQKCKVCKGSKVSVVGTVRSYEDVDPKRQKHHMKMYAQVEEMEVVPNDEPDKNEVFLSGTIHGTPVLRQTPLARTITDFSIISHATPKRTFMLWCIAWGSTAYSINEKVAGDDVTFRGRFQSRDYTKKWEDGEEKRTVQEISVMDLIE